MIPVVICGGVGSKMWPLSSPRLPKQFLPFILGKSLFEINWEILRNRYQPEEIYLQTNHEQAQIAKRLVPEIHEENIFIEPESRNQGPATGLAAALLSKLGKQKEPFFLVQVDVMRTPAERFFAMMDLADKLGTETDKYITGGFEPSRIVRGVDYLVKGQQVDELNGVKVFQVADYIGRDDEARIASLVGSGKLLVHANHTTMSPENLLKMFQKYRPEWYLPLSRIVAGADVATEYPNLPKGALEEITKEVHLDGGSLVIELPFKWDDFGTWESLEKYYQDNDIFPENGGVVEIDANNNFAYSQSKKKVAIIGVDNVMVVEGNDGILVTKRDSCGRVGEVV